jgi:hypothetical protein
MKYFLLISILFLTINQSLITNNIKDISIVIDYPTIDYSNPTGASYESKTKKENEKITEKKEVIVCNKGNQPIEIKSTKDFWDWLFLIITTIATFGLFIYAAFGESIKKRWYSPKLVIEDNCLDCALTADNKNIPVYFYYLKIKNLKPLNLAKNCRLILHSARKYINNKEVQVKIFVPLQFIWIPSETTPYLINITEKGTVDFGKIFKGWSSYSPCLNVYPNNFDGYVYQNEKVIYYIKIEADNFYSEKIYEIEVSWDGVWDDDIEEMKKHLIVKKL